MLKIRLKERREERLSELNFTDTFKIPESSYIFMKIDVDGLTVRPKITAERPEGSEELKPIKVLVPAGKTPVVCLSTGIAQFINLNEKVQVVDLDAIEIANEKETKEEENK